MSKEVSILNIVQKMSKYFPFPAPLLAKKISAITNAFNVSNKQVDPAGTGIKSLVLTPVTYPLIMVVNAPTDAVAQAWLEDATVDAYGIQYWYIPVGNMVAIPFDTPVVRWDLLSTGAGSTAAYQRIAR